jgi:hypothetical protein
MDDKTTPAPIVETQRLLSDGAQEIDGAAPNPPISASRVDRVLSSVAGSAEKKFILGSIAVPLTISVMTLVAGGLLNASYQNWHDRTTRTRNTISEMKTAAADLTLRVSDLETQGTFAEFRFEESQVAEALRRVKDSLNRLESQAGSVDRFLLSSSSRDSSAGISGRIVACRAAVASYEGCLSAALNQKKETTDAGCTAKFQTQDACLSLEKMVYALEY